MKITAAVAAAKREKGRRRERNGLLHTSLPLKKACGLLKMKNNEESMSYNEEYYIMKERNNANSPLNVIKCCGVVCVCG